MHVEMFSRHEDGIWRFELLARPEESLAIPMLELFPTLDEIYDGVTFAPTEPQTDSLASLRSEATQVNPLGSQRLKL